MWRITKKNAFTLPEVLIGTIIFIFVALGTWMVYEMFIIWWHEQAPAAEAQQIARAALRGVIEGSEDSTAGTDRMGYTTYARRNGLTEATNTNFDFTAPIESANQISFALENPPDTSGTPRTYRVGVDAATGSNVVQYVDRNGTSHNLRGTLGITSLTFSEVADLSNPTSTDPMDGVIRVTATVTRPQSLGRAEVNVSYSEDVYLRGR